MATITVVAYKGISTRAADAAMTAEIGQLTKQLEAIKVEQGEYPWAIPNFSSELIAQHNNTSSTASMNFVVNRLSMSALEQQKLESFRLSTGINLPMNTLYFYGWNTGWGKQVAFIMAVFKDKNNIPTEINPIE